MFVKLIRFAVRLTTGLTTRLVVQTVIYERGRLSQLIGLWHMFIMLLTYASHGVLALQGMQFYRARRLEMVSRAQYRQKRSDVVTTIGFVFVVSSTLVSDHRRSGVSHPLLLMMIDATHTNTYEAVYASQVSRSPAGSSDGSVFTFHGQNGLTPFELFK